MRFEVLVLAVLSGCSSCEMTLHDDAGSSRDMNVSGDAGELCAAELLSVDTDAFDFRASVELTKLSVFDDARGALIGVYSMRVEGGVEITTVIFGRIDEPDAPALRQVGDAIDTEGLLGVFEEEERVRVVTREADGHVAIRDVGDAAFESPVVFDWRDPTTDEPLSQLQPCVGGGAFFANVPGNEEDRPIGLVFGRETEGGVSIERTTLDDYTRLLACVALSDGRIIGFGRDYARRLVTLAWNDDGNAEPDESLTGDYDAWPGEFVIDDAAPFSPMLIDVEAGSGGIGIRRLNGLRVEIVVDDRFIFPLGGNRRMKLCDTFVRSDGAVEVLVDWSGNASEWEPSSDTLPRTYSVDFVAPSTLNSPRLISPTRCSGSFSREGALYLPVVLGGSELSLVRECRE